MACWGIVKLTVAHVQLLGGVESPEQPRGLFFYDICHFLTSVLRLNAVLSKERVHQDKEPIDLAEGSGGTEHSSLILSFFSTDRWPRKPSSEEHVHGIAYLGVSGR